MKTCRQKARWINAAISFGIDLQVIFRIGMREDKRKLAPDDDNDNDNGNGKLHYMYVFFFDSILFLITQ